MKILTFNHHESYLSLLAKTGHSFDVVVRYKNLDLSWSKRQAAPPSNFKFVEWNSDLKKKIRDSEYDVIIAHTLKNLLWMFGFFKPKFVFVAHIPLFKYSLPLRIKSFFKKLAYRVFAWTHDVTFHAVSEFKRESWGEAGSVAVLSPQKFMPIPNEQSKIVFVCNDLATRKLELGYDLLMQIGQRVPIQIIGNNPGIPGAFIPKDFADFQKHFCAGKIYLYTVRYPYGDGYNTAMLEAMQLGMAVVTIDNPTSPIVHNKNGLVGRNAEELVKHLQYLLANPEVAERLGKAAQETIVSQFSQTKFVDAWLRIIPSESCEPQGSDVKMYPSSHQAKE